jgi:hypothetical protein
MAPSPLLILFGTYVEIYHIKGNHSLMSCLFGIYFNLFFGTKVDDVVLRLC